MRTPTDLPVDLRAALDRLSYGKSRRMIGALAAEQSCRYRTGGVSGGITTRDDALAYAFTRLPATYAAAVAVFDALRETRPTFEPRIMLDVGAGPGTAAFAAVQVFGHLESIRLIDTNPALRDLALTLMAESDSDSLHHASYHLGDALAKLGGEEPVDLVVTSYAAGEIATADLAHFARSLWSATAQVLAVIEPGTPAGYARIMGIRSALIAAGAFVAAPCPHERGCPLVAPDWCHFARRLPRSRDHRTIKGADVPFEDEKFSYVVATRTQPRRIDARVLAPPAIKKGTVATKLCTETSVVADVATRRQEDDYRRRKSWRWGDAVTRQ